LDEEGYHNGGDGYDMIRTVEGYYDLVMMLHVQTIFLTPLACLPVKAQNSHPFPRHYSDRVFEEK